MNCPVPSRRPLVLTEVRLEYSVARCVARLFVVPAAHDDMQSLAVEDATGLWVLVPSDRKLKHLYQRRLAPLFPTVSPRASVNMGADAEGREAL